MNIGKVFSKGLLGGLTFLVAYVASNPQVVTNLIPENISQMTIGGLVGFVIVAVTNWFKNRAK